MLGTLLVPSASLKSFLEKATATYQTDLAADPLGPAGTYLKSRGLSWGSVTSFRLGVVENPLPGHELYQGRIAIPYLTRSGVVSMRFRAVPPDDSMGKYMSVPGDEPRIFNPSAVCGREVYAAICEGEMDAITATQCGIPSVGIAGVNGWRPWFARAFQGYEAVYILCDNDDKGQGKQFGEKVAAQVPNSRIVLLPAGHDVNSLLVSEGPEALKSLLEVE
jgi:DNA primase